MYKSKILNADILSCLAKLGHKDEFTIADCGLPIPDNVQRIDLALTKMTPSFIETLTTLVDDIEIESITLATEIQEENPDINNKIKEIFEKSNTKIHYIPHSSFKIKTLKSKAIIRTGEVTPYANIIITSGVYF